MAPGTTPSKEAAKIIEALEEEKKDLYEQEYKARWDGDWVAAAPIIPEESLEWKEGDFQKANARIDELEEKERRVSQLEEKAAHLQKDLHRKTKLWENQRASIRSYQNQIGDLYDKLEDLKDLIKISCADDTWNYDPYFHGMANGMICALAVMTGGEPKYLKAPEKWLKDITNQFEDYERAMELLK